MRPAILLFTNEYENESIREICAGIEEEGVLFEIKKQSYSSLAALTYEATQQSLLGCGIGVWKGAAAFQLLNLPMGQFVLQTDGDTMNYRRLGKNAARGVKKLPFDL